MSRRNSLDYLGSTKNESIGSLDIPDLGESFLRGRQYGENSALNQVKIQEAKIGLADLEATQNLRSLAAQGDRAAMRALAARDPEYGERFQKYENETTYALGREATAAIQNTPIEFRNKAYASIYRKAEAMGKDVSYFPLPDGPWSDKKQEALEFASKQGMSLSQEIQRQQLALRNREVSFQERGGVAGALADRQSDPSFRKNYAASGLAKEGLIVDPDGDVKPLKNLPQAKGELKREEKIGTDVGERIAIAKNTLPKAIDQAKYSKKLIDDLINHPGLSDAVGAKNLLSGALPMVFGRKPIAGSDAANFMSRLDQIKGSQFLEAYETLKGGGTITEVEGEKAQDAISRMQSAQSEEEFKAAAKEFKDIVDTGLERLKNVAAGKSVLLPPANTESETDITEEDINHTAKIHGVTPDEVRRRLGK